MFWKLLAFVMVCGLFLGNLGQIDLGSWGVSPEAKEKIEMLLQLREILTNIMEMLPWGSTIAERSTEIQLAAAVPGILLVLIEGIFLLLRFLIGAGVIVVAAVIIFSLVQNHATALAGGGVSAYQQGSSVPSVINRSFPLPMPQIETFRPSGRRR
jgi:hypothetical protein